MPVKLGTDVRELSEGQGETRGRVPTLHTGLSLQAPCPADAHHPQGTGLLEPAAAGDGMPLHRRHFHWGHRERATAVGTVPCWVLGARASGQTAIAPWTF